jgi:hypothetical protein
MRVCEICGKTPALIYYKKSVSLVPLKQVYRCEEHNGGDDL